MAEKIKNILSDYDLLKFEHIIPSATIIFNLDEILFINSSFKKVIGCEINRLRNMKLKDFIFNDQKRIVLENISMLLNEKIKESEIELRVKCSHDVEKWIECISRTVYYNNKLYIITSFVDITNSKRSQKELSQLLILRDAMLEVTHSVITADGIDTIYELILKNAIKSIKNATLGTILLKDGDNLKVVSQVGFDIENIEKFEIPIEKSFIYRLTRGQLDEIKKIDDLRNIADFIKIKTENNKSEFIKSTITAPIYVNGHFLGVVNIDSTQMSAFDENDLKVMEFIRNNVEIAIANHMLYEEKVELSKYDSLTKLYNRYYFEELFEHVKARALRYNEGFNVVVFDINNLKEINDNFGHIAGDSVLQFFSRNASQIIRKSDILARYGGDEFVGIFLNSNKYLMKRRLDEYLVYLENNLINIDKYKIKCSFSYGISTFLDDGTNITDLIKVADRRMYEFKYNYKNGDKIN